MHIEPAAIADVLIIKPEKFSDHRGFFSETFKQPALRRAGVDLDWIQDNHSFSIAPNTVRGLHFQKPPFAQAKLVRVTRGAIFDVAVDIRAGSPSYGRHVGIELSADNWLQLYVPIGFAHGYCTLAPSTEIVLKVTSAHRPAAEDGLLWNDPDLAIDWPAGVCAGAAAMSARDLTWPRLRDFVSPF